MEITFYELGHQFEPIRFQHRSSSFSCDNGNAFIKAALKVSFIGLRFQLQAPENILMNLQVS
jgi:hypothetical protein